MGGRESGVNNLSITKEGGGMASRTIAKFALSYQTITSEMISNGLKS